MRSASLRQTGAFALLAGVLLVGAPAAAQVRVREAPKEASAKANTTYVVAGPQELIDAAAPLLKHRGGEFQIKTVVWAAPARGPVLKAQIKRHDPRYLLLLGDIDVVPTFVVSKAATDRPYGDWNDDGFPEVAIGRIPLSDPRQVRAVCERIVAYETTRPAGLWQRQCALLANEGRFAPAIDQLIEQVFTRVIKQVLPTPYDVDLTYANPKSPYCYPPAGFAGRVSERLNEGALVFAYIGHGNKRSFDTLQIPQSDGKTKRYRVLDVRDVPRLALAKRSPIVVAIACWTGQLDGKQASIGETLMASSDGPVAFFGASRISHPLHNALLAKELVYEFFHGQGPVRLGPALDRARTALVNGRPNDKIRAQVLGMGSLFVKSDEIESEMPRHVDMYNLFGDPAMVLARPEGQVKLEAFREGGEIVVKGTIHPAKGRMSVRISVETDRDGMAQPQPTTDNETGAQRYARANDKVLRATFVVSDATGKFTARLPAPRRGARFVKVFATDGTKSAIGGTPLR